MVVGNSEESPPEASNVVSVSPSNRQQLQTAMKLQFEEFVRTMVSKFGGQWHFNHFSDPEFDFFFIRRNKDTEIGAQAAETAVESTSKPPMVDPKLFQSLKPNLPTSLDCIVHHIQPDSPVGPLVYVIAAEKNKLCGKIFRKCNAAPSPEVKPEQVSLEAIKPGETFIAQTIEDKYLYRVVVLKAPSVPPPGLILVRLMDFGNVTYAQAATFRRMEGKLQAISGLAFPIFFVDEEDSFEDLKVNERITVEFVDGPEPSTVRKALLIRDEDAEVAEISVLSALSEKRYVVNFLRHEVGQKDKTMALFKLHNVPDDFEMDLVKAGDIVIVYDEDIGKVRGKVIKSIESHALLFYLDFGLVQVAELPVLKCPKEIKEVVPLAQTMKLERFDEEIGELFQKGVEFKLKIEEGDTETRKYAGHLQVGPNKSVGAFLEPFIVDLDAYGVPYWSHPVHSDSIVDLVDFKPNNPLLLTVIDEDKVDNYKKWLKKMLLGDLKPCSRPLQRNEVVLHVEKQRNISRLLILADHEDGISALNLDSGEFGIFAPILLFKSNDFIRNVPVHVMQVKLIDLAAVAAENPVLVREFLHDFIEKKPKLTIQYEGVFMGSAKLVTEKGESVGERIGKFVERKLATEEPKKD